MSSDDAFCVKTQDIMPLYVCSFPFGDGIWCCAYVKEGRVKIGSTLMRLFPIFLLIFAVAPLLLNGLQLNCRHVTLSRILFLNFLPIVIVPVVQLITSYSTHHIPRDVRRAVMPLVILQVIILMLCCLNKPEKI